MTDPSPPAVPDPAASPHEREGELEVLSAVIAGAAAGVGELAVVEAAAGLGKSRLLDETAARAAAAGVRVLSARASELERSFPFGVALQLFGPAVEALSAEAREAVFTGAARLAAPLFSGEAVREDAAGTPDFSLMHGLYWLASNLADRTPLALLVDDAHWADEPSLRLCAYLAQRIDELPVALVIAARPGEPGAPQELLASLAGHRLAQRLRPGPLSADGVAAIVAEVMGDPPDERFAAACARLTGGNPFLLRALLAAASAAGLRPVAADAPRVPELAPEGVLQALSARLARLPAAAGEVARAVAVLGDDARLRHAAALAGLDLEDATRGADALAAAEVLRPGEPLTFVHPLARAAVVAGLPVDVRAAAHLRAAELLRAEGAPAERLAAHLVAAPAGGRPWVVEALRASAARSIALGAPAAAATALRRALEELTPQAAADSPAASAPAPSAPPPAAPSPPPAAPSAPPPAAPSAPPGAPEPAPSDLSPRGPLLIELGRAEATAGLASAGARFAEAARVLAEPGERADAHPALARTRIAAGDHRGARAAYRAALAELGAADAGLAAHLRAEQLVVAALDPAEPPDEDAIEAILRHDRVGATPAGRALLATLAVHELYAGAPRDRVLALADRALADGALLDDEGARETSVFGVVLTLFVGEELARADALLSDLVTGARESGNVMALASASYSRAWARLIAGRVTEAVDDAQQAVDAGAHGWRMFLPGAYAALTHALLDQGDVEEAERQLLEAEALSGEDDVNGIQVRDARGRVHLARDRPAEAAAEFLVAGELAGPQRNPLLFATWRSNAAVALARTGERARALALADEELELAREFGAPRGIGVALRALGTIEPDPRGLELLSQSVEALEGSEALLERARSLTAYGGALRRAGRRKEAGAALGEALEIARAGGAGAVERWAGEELAAAGPRAQRASRRGREALSPSERRVAHLAADGWSNREIAEELFVTRKAVEWHLRNAYVKLGIASRRDLPEALGLNPAA
jgi:DNA-binding CsgD family transcriptional regulator